MSYGKAGAFTDDNGKAIGSGAPSLNAVNHRSYFTGRTTISSTVPPGRACRAGLPTRARKAFGQDVSLNGQTKHTLYLSSDNDFLATFVLDDELQSHVYDNPSKIFVFAFDQGDLNALGTESTVFSPEQFPSFLFGLPAFNPRGGFPFF
jgi:hypothetical protein